MSDPPAAPRDAAALPLGPLADALDSLLGKTGPKAPPGYTKATDQNWARDHQEEILRAAEALCRILYPSGLPAAGNFLEPSRCGILARYQVPREFLVAWGRLYETFTPILDRWGFAFIEGKFHAVREPDSWESAVRPKDTTLVVFSTPEIFMLPFPLDITDEEHEALRWVRESLGNLSGPGGGQAWDAPSKTQAVTETAPERPVLSPPESAFEELPAPETLAVTDAVPPKREPSAKRTPGFRRGELDERATAVLMSNPTLTYVQIAAILGCNPGSLKNKKLTKFHAAQEMLGRGKERYRLPSKGRDEEDERDAG
jgi:hypothetical protein